MKAMLTCATGTRHLRFEETTTSFRDNITKVRIYGDFEICWLCQQLKELGLYFVETKAWFLATDTCKLLRGRNRVRNFHRRKIV